VLIGEDWTIWRVDFSRAFRTIKTCASRGFGEMRPPAVRKTEGAEADELTRKTKRYLTKSQVNGVMARREQNRSHFPNPYRRKRRERSPLLARPKRTALYPSSPASRMINQKKTPSQIGFR